MGCQTLTAKPIHHKCAEMKIDNLSKPCIQGFGGGEDERKVVFKIGKVQQFVWLSFFLHDFNKD